LCKKVKVVIASRLGEPEQGATELPGLVGFKSK